MPPKASTIHGPVGIFGRLALIIVPTTAAVAAKTAESTSIKRNEAVQDRAAAAGVINNAAINTTPTD